ANIEAVEHYQGVTVRAVEFDGDAFPCVCGRKFKDAAIPADDRRRVGASQRIKTLAGESGVVLKGQLDGPVVRQIHASPVTIIEGNRASGEKVPRLLEVARHSAPESEVLGWVIGMSKMEAPAEIQEKTFSASS